MVHEIEGRARASSRLNYRYLLAEDTLPSFAMEGGGIIHFDPYVSRIEAGFWHELSQRKLEKYKLSEAEQEITGCYSNSM